MTEQLVCTVITKNYLALARALASTLAEYNPNSKLLVLLADRVDKYFDPSGESFKLILLEELPNQDKIHQMCFYYNAMELCNALKPFLHEYIINNLSVESWIYLDSDIMVIHSLEKIFDQLKKTSILLNPHCNTPVDIKYVIPHEMNILQGGLYNGGFLGLRRTDETKAFISWFKEHLINFCFNDPALGNPRGLYVDQLWLNLVPMYFKNVSFLVEPGANLGHWNLFERTLGKDDCGRITVDGQPLLFVHFSGWDISMPHRISKYNSMYEERDIPIWTDISEKYRNILIANEYEEAMQLPYAFNYFQSGELISLEMRRLYYDELMKGTAIAGSPFRNYSYFQSKFCHQTTNDKSSANFFKILSRRLKILLT